jgi:predicted acyltransferase
MTQLHSRLRSLDAFRGFTILGMILVNNPGDWNNTYAQLLHAKWHGWTFTDWIFPFFLFISGVSMVISVGQKRNHGNRVVLCANLLKRALIIFALGLALNFIPNFDLSTLRIPGVLQRIGLCVALATPLVVYFGWRGQAIAAGFAIAVYSALMLWLPVPDANGIRVTGSLEAGRDAGAYFDRLLMNGHLWASAKTWDPEGVLSSLPALSSLLFGCLTAHLLQASTDRNKVFTGLMIGAVFCLILGQVLHIEFMPINKSLWTPSYAIFMTGVALGIFGWFYWAVDVVKWTRAQVFVIVGMNALFLFVMSSLIAKALNAIKFSNSTGLLVNLKSYLYLPLKSLGLGAQNTSLLFALCFCLVMFLLGWFMYRRNWFIKV